jgi:hypothetical protein
LGKFDPQKAAAKGLKPGVKYGKLQKGEAVISDDSDEMVNMFTLSKVFFFICGFLCFH